MFIVYIIKQIRKAGKKIYFRVSFILQSNVGIFSGFVL